MVTRPEVIQRLAAEKRLDAVVQLARSQEPPAARRQFLQRLCSSPACLGPLLEQGFFDALHRRLDDALQHALRAVELDPDHAAYLDTLAEAHFHLGDRDAAVRHSRRAAERRPQDTTLQEQLRRFEQAPLPEPGK